MARRMWRGSERLVSKQQKKARFRKRALQQSCELLLLRPRILRTHSVDAVVDDELAVVLGGVFNQGVGQFGPASFGWKTGLEFDVHALVALRFDQIGAILHALFHERDNLGLRLVVVGLWIVAEPGLLAVRRVSEVVHGRRRVE